MISPEMALVAGAGLSLLVLLQCGVKGGVFGDVVVVEGS
jgi:hypothetical protein